MSKINLDDWHKQAQNDEPVNMADNDLQVAAEFLAVVLEDEKHSQLSSTDIMRKHPELVAAHTLAHAINRLELTHCTVKIEELRLLESIADSLKAIASTSKGKINE